MPGALRVREGCSWQEMGVCIRIIERGPSAALPLLLDFAAHPETRFGLTLRLHPGSASRDGLHTPRLPFKPPVGWAGGEVEHSTDPLTTRGIPLDFAGIA